MASALLLLAACIAGVGYLKVQLDRLFDIPPSLGRATGLLTRAEPNEPATALIIGTDKRLGASGSGQADALMLVRVDPRDRVISMTSIPRSTHVVLPGSGLSFINEAFSEGGPELTLAAVKEVTGLEINFLAVVEFHGFEEVIDAVGGLYLEIDHRYLHDGVPMFEPIDLQPGYQLLDGRNALVFARNRHADSDYYRIARQLLVLHELRERVGAIPSSPMGMVFHAPSFISLLKAVAGSVDLASAGGEVSLTAALGWIRTIESIGDGQLVTVPVPASDRVSLQKAIRQLIDPLGDLPAHGPLSLAELLSGPATVEADSVGALDSFRAVAERRRVRVLYPTVRELSSKAEGSPRLYDIDTGKGHARAMRATFRVGGGPDYWGIQATTWTEAPVLQDPTYTRFWGAREYRLYFNGPLLHRVAFEEAGVAYWVTNTLFDRLTNPTMISIARSLRPLP